MRVTGGCWRSRRLRGPAKHQRLRPTPDAMRERCFAILGPSLAGARVLDLFAGTGAVGIEALSRDAATALFVEAHRSAVTIIRANLQSLDIGDDRARVLLRPAAKAVSDLGRTGAVFDLIWADPPFEAWEDGLDALVASVETGVVAGDGVLCLECPAGAEVEQRLPASLELQRDVTGGASRVVMLRPTSRRVR